MTPNTNRVLIKDLKELKVEAKMFSKEKEDKVVGLTATIVCVGLNEKDVAPNNLFEGESVLLFPGVNPVKVHSSLHDSEEPLYLIKRNQIELTF